MVLPTDFLNLTIPEQLFVLTNLERVDRGKRPIAGLSHALDAIARTGANAGKDPNGEGAVEASTTNFDAMYLWMYDDGCVGLYVANLTCPYGAWGHRNNILGPYPPGSLMGAAEGKEGTAELFFPFAGKNPYFTWSEVVPYLPSFSTSTNLSEAYTQNPARPASVPVTVWTSGSPTDVSAAITWGHQVFSVSPQQCMILPGQRCTLAVTVRPRSSGVSEGTLLLGDAHAQTKVHLQGIAGLGYWLATSSGKVYAYGDAGHYGSLSPSQANASIVAMAATADGKGYWLLRSDGRVFALGDAAPYGSVDSDQLGGDATTITTTPDGKGYWVGSSHYQLFAFGDATLFKPHCCIAPIDSDIVSVLPSADGDGYRLVGSLGYIDSYGDADPMLIGNVRCNPAGGAAAANGGGFWVVSRSGRVCAWKATSYGPGGGLAGRSVRGIVATPDEKGYWLFTARGDVLGYGDAANEGSAPPGDDVVSMAAVG